MLYRRLRMFCQYAGARRRIGKNRAHSDNRDGDPARRGPLRWSRSRLLARASLSLLGPATLGDGLPGLQHGFRTYLHG